MNPLLLKYLLPAFIALQSIAQPPQTKNLIFEGAGIRGIAYAGVLDVLEKKGISDDIEKVGGTSAGALAALLFSLNYTSTEIGAIISGTKFQKLNDGKFLFIGGILRSKKRYGWYRGEKLTNWIGWLIEAKTGNAEITFEEFHEEGYIDLYVTATCMNCQEMVVLSHETYPKMKVRDAIRISMSIPLYYAAVFVDSIGNTFTKPIEGENLDVMVDGGIIGNFPIHIFDSFETDSAGVEHRIPNPATIGVRIDTEIQIQKDAEDRQLAEYEIEDFKDYTTAFYTLVIENLNRNELTEADWNRTISVSSVGISPRVKKLSNAQKEKLINSGIESTVNFFSD